MEPEVVDLVIIGAGKFPSPLLTPLNSSTAHIHQELCQLKPNRNRLARPRGGQSRTRARFKYQFGCSGIRRLSWGCLGRGALIHWTQDE